MNEESTVEITTDEEFRDKGTETKFFADTTFFPQMIHTVKKGDRIYIGDGMVKLIVKDIGMDNIMCKVENAGKENTHKSKTIL